MEYAFREGKELEFENFAQLVAGVKPGDLVVRIRHSRYCSSVPITTDLTVYRTTKTMVFFTIGIRVNNRGTIHSSSSTSEQLHTASTADLEEAKSANHRMKRELTLMESVSDKKIREFSLETIEKILSVIAEDKISSTICDSGKSYLDVNA